MKSMVWWDGLLLSSDIFQRRLPALMGKCCLFTFFTAFSVVLSLVLLRAKSFLGRPDNEDLRHSALEFKIRFSLLSPCSPLFFV